MEKRTDRILLTGMEFYGYHGCLSEERRTGQTFLVDLEMYLDLQPAGDSDALEDTVNYAEVFEEVRRIVEGEPRKLIESVAEAISRRLLENFPKLERVRVTLHKPSAPIEGKFRDAAVSIERGRV